ncbi:MAG: flagellar protein FlaG [Oxalobacter sp.]|nr:MAG: flagellar protein FlaG [Oxalobacter sp.]
MDIGNVGNIANHSQTVASVGSQPTPAQSSVQSSAAPVQTVNAVQQASTPPSMEQLKQAVQEMNNAVQYHARGLQFSLDDESDRTIVKVIDSETREVIRQIPSEEVLAISKSLDQAIGSLLKKAV